MVFRPVASYDFSNKKDIVKRSFLENQDISLGIELSFSKSFDLSKFNSQYKNKKYDLKNLNILDITEENTDI